MALWRPLLVLTVCLFALHKTALGQDEGASIACDMRPGLISYLWDRYEERQIEWVLVDDLSIKELFASPTYGTWSILRTYTSGASCVVQVGYTGPWSDL